jgi:phage regulator Rha-like protein
MVSKNKTHRGKTVKNQNGTKEQLVRELAEMRQRIAELEASEAEWVRAEEALAQRVEELERFRRLAVGRELRMIELKRQVNELSEQLGKEPPYDLSLLE